MISPDASTTTAPTRGLGAANAIPRRANSSACAMKRSSGLALTAIVRSSKERLHEIFRVEGQNVAGLLADAHVPHRQPKLARDSDDHAALGRAIELCEDDSRHAR